MYNYGISQMKIADHNTIIRFQPIYQITIAIIIDVCFFHHL